MKEKNQDHQDQYAIIKTGGKQYRVANGDIIDVELLEGKDGEKAELGAKVEFKDVLFFGKGSDFKIGGPFLKNGVVTGEVIDACAKGPKIMSVKYKRSHHQYRKFGHRQHYSRIKIIGIQA